MAGKSCVQGNIDQRSVGFHDALKRPANPELLAVLMQGVSGSTTEQSAQVINRYPNFVREIAQRQALCPLPAENKFYVVDDFALLRAHNVWPQVCFCAVCRSHHLVQQTHNHLFNHQRIFHYSACNLLEKLALGKVHGRISPAARKLEGPFWMLFECRVKGPHDILHDIDFNTEPIATVSFDAHWVSEISLPLIVEGHHIRIGNEGAFVLVLNLDRGSWKYEAAISCRSRVAKRRIIGMAAKSAEPDQPTVEYDSIDLRPYGDRHAIWYLFDRGSGQTGDGSSVL